MIMKKVVLFLMSLCVLTLASAQNKNGGRFMKPEEYKEKLQNFITQRAELTEAEAKAFFPVYFELQTEKFKLNGSVRKKMRELAQDGLTEDEAAEMLDETADMKMKCDKLDKDYLTKFKAILPASKLLKVQMAEEAFRRELLNSMQRGGQFRGNPRPGENRRQRTEQK